MSYIDIAITSVYHDRFPVEANNEKWIKDGLLNVDVAVVGTDMSAEDMKEVLRKALILRCMLTPRTPDA